MKRIIIFFHLIIKFNISCYLLLNSKNLYKLLQYFLSFDISAILFNAKSVLIKTNVIPYFPKMAF